MFKIEDKYKTIDSEWATIEDNFHVFHFDEFPILYAGTNYLGNKIIGSLCCEDDEGEVFRHFHGIVTNKHYNDFIRRNISYKNLLLSLKSVYVIDKHISGYIIQSFQVPSNFIPLEYLPLEGVFCPNVERTVGFDYSVSLQGKMADLHEAFSGTVASIGKSTDKVLNRIADALNIKSLNPQVHQLPSLEGSFKLNFRVKVANTSLFYKEYILQRYFQRCLDYSINTLAGEAKQLTSGDISGTAFEKQLMPSVREVYESFSYKIDENYAQNFANSLVEAIDDIETISSQVGNGFSGIEFLGHDSDNKEVSLGFIDKQSAGEITAVSEYITSIPQKGEVNDDSYNEYRILVYDLNTDTRKGTAHIGNSTDTDIMDNPKIKVEGMGDLAGSVYTESLHFNKWIMVKAKAKVINGKFKLLTILSEE